MANGNIHYDTLLLLHQRYLDNKRKILNNGSQKEETKFIWFKLDTSMRSFLKEILADENVNGLKAYILQYPEHQTQMGAEIIPINPDDVNQLTIGFVTTKDDGGRRVDYPESIKTNSPMLLAPPMNHGELCPRICP